MPLVSFIRAILEALAGIALSLAAISVLASCTPVTMSPVVGEVRSDRIDAAPWHYGDLDGVCVAFSGGGARSAATSIGVMSLLVERGYLQRLKLISAVSGGSWATAWLYTQAARDDAAKDAGNFSKFFDPRGANQSYLEKKFALGDEAGFAYGLSVFLQGTGAVTLAPLHLLGADNARFANNSNLRCEYLRGLSRGVLTAVSQDQKPEPLNLRQPPRFNFAHGMALDCLEVQPLTVSEVSSLTKERGLPPFVFGATWTAGTDAPRSSRSSRSKLDDMYWYYEIGSHGFGSHASGYSTWSAMEFDPRDPYEPKSIVANFPMTPAISGAALDDGAPMVQGWLRWLMRALNLRLGYWTSVEATAEDGKLSHIYLSDGGHSENLGAISLLRHSCRDWVIVDNTAESKGPSPDNFEFSAWNDLMRLMTRKERMVDDFRFKWHDADIASSSWKKTGVLRGKWTRGAEEGEVVYLKLLLPDRAMNLPAVAELFASGNHKKFPHDPVFDQNYDELRYRAYRDLGRLLAENADPYIAELFLD